MPFDATDFEVTTLPDPLALKTPRERLEYLRDFLRALPDEKFDLGHWANRCGTVCCVGGWAEVIFTGEAYGLRDAEAGELVGLRRDQSDALFYPLAATMLADGTPVYRANPRDAAQVLDHLLNTGRVDWSVARAEA